MKTFMTAAVAALALNAASVTFAADHDCNKIPNPSRFMPTELSERQKCLIDHYKADEEHGIAGSLFWLRVNGKLYSVQWRSIVDDEQRDAWLDGIKEDQLSMYENAAEVVETEAAINMLEEELAVIEAAKDIVILSNVVPQEQFNGLLAQYDEVVQKLAVQIIETEIALDHMYDHIENLRGEIDELKDQLASIKDNALASFNVSPKLDIQDSSFGLASQHVKGIRGSKVLAVIQGNTTWLNEVKNFKSKVNVDGEWRTFTINNADSIFTTAKGWEELVTEITRMIDDAYDAGYEDGYEQGYKDGYADGFEDGVNSVK